MTSVGCPVCGRAIRCTVEGATTNGLSIILDRASVAWHVANCYSGPRDRESFVSILPTARGFGANLGRAA